MGGNFRESNLLGSPYLDMRESSMENFKFKEKFEIELKSTKPVKPSIIVAI